MIGSKIHLATAMIDFSLPEEELAEIKNDRCLLLIDEEWKLHNFWIRFKGGYKTS